MLRYTLIRQIDEDLETEKSEIITYVSKYNKLPEALPTKDQSIIYEHVSNIFKGDSRLRGNDAKDIFIKEKFKTRRQEKKDDDYFRQLTFPLQVVNDYYKVTVSKPLEGIENIIRSVLVITSITILLILISAFLINRAVMIKLWSPFYSSLHTLQRFKVSTNEKLSFTETDIDEFNFMNKMLETATAKASRDYESLKEFTENASHELQTPLAIIRSKLEVLFQEENLTEQQRTAVGSAFDAIQRLSKLNQSLLFLTKIDNNQFAEIKEIDLSKLLENKITQLEELWESKHLHIDKKIEQTYIYINPSLSEILLNNLLSNAIKYTPDNGVIRILLKEKELLIANTGSHSLETDKIFQRFYKPVNNPNSNGLGLAIIKQICDVSSFKINYSFRDNMHCFVIVFSSLTQFEPT
jgi:signal transduction histidine kinase